MKYEIGQKVNISVQALYNGDADFEYTNIDLEHDGDNKFYKLYNENDDLCCLDGEECIIDHIVADGLYDLINDNGETAIHFMLSEKDLDIAVFKGKNIDDMTETEARIYINKKFDEYESQGFAKTFVGEKMLNGKKFEVIGRVGFPNEPNGAAELCMLPMWNIKFANGITCAAYPEEICLSERRL